ncbi:MAG: exo-alpha-sialidase, partial [Nitrospirota bacterium]|nr:exo-alpha-sialidase [Nitrospirota bacterium]
ILAMLRSENGGTGSLHQTLSLDEGWTWSDPERLDLWGYPADLLVLQTGQIVMAYGYRQFPPGIRCCVADAAGLSWSIHRERILRHDGHDNGELGYPATVALGGGDLLTVYYFTGREGGQPYIAGTRFTVE